MTLIVVEHSFHLQSALSALEARVRVVLSCLEAEPVAPRISYVSKDRCHLVCFYDSKDAEAVRISQHKADSPPAHLWTATEIGPSHLGDPAPKTAVVCPRAFDQPVTSTDVRNMMEQASGCGHIYRVGHLGTFLSSDGTRAICIYAAPDADSVRSINDRFQLPAERVFAASVHFPSAAK